ncbi:hypothetical protein [Nocardioides sp. J54]|uniref:hypothetical protein n=1 Tax=Nocardioides sp. J54 TaxID=935866 RepID=UPI00048BE5F3|nr:hypothetical protein [Nocardioides sp. J54]
MDNPDEALARFAAQQPGAALGDVLGASGRSLQPISRAGQEAATNLLDKATRGLLTGDMDRARRFADRACRLAYDRHEESHPAATVAHMQFFDLVVDTLEDCEPGDTLWLQAAAMAAADADERGRSEVRDVLEAISRDYHLTRREHAAVRAAVVDLPVLTSAWELRFGPAEHDAFVETVLSMLRVTIGYLAALGALEGVGS